MQKDKKWACDLTFTEWCAGCVEAGLPETYQSQEEYANAQAYDTNIKKYYEDLAKNSPTPETPFVAQQVESEDDKKARAFEMLGQGLSKRKIAKALLVPRTTVRRWIDDPKPEDF